MAKQGLRAQPGLRPTTPAQAWAWLQVGNARFMAGESNHPQQTAAVRSRVATKQRPFVTFLGCADSRVPPEIVVDQGLGDVFVTRTAGHVIGPTVLGSLEYAVSHLRVPLLVVLGHSGCGAIAATCASMQTGAIPGGFVRDLVERIALSAVAVHARTGQYEPSSVGLEHVRRTCEAIAERSSYIRAGIDRDELAIAGCTYDLAEGELELVHVVGDVGALPKGR